MSKLRLILLLVLAAGVLSSCALPYYWQAVGGQIQLLRKRTPIDRIVVDPSIDDATRTNLERVAELRRFAVTELGLPDNDSYKSYVDLGRDYVVWNVVAAEEFSVEPVRWCFPFAGCVAYRGYFDRNDAERFETNMRDEGFDTYSGGSSAYSTLGYFDDPIVNTMLAGSPEYVAGVLFHELAHQQVYVKGDSELSEAFATAVEEYGVESWLAYRSDEQALERYRGRLARRDEFARIVIEQQARLRAIYAARSSPEAKREAKAAAFAAMRADYELAKAGWGGAADYDRWFAGELNNASLAAVATYRRWVPALRARLEELGPETFYAEVEELADRPTGERTRWLEAWTRGRSAPEGALAQSR